MVARYIVGTLVPRYIVVHLSRIPYIAEFLPGATLHAVYAFQTTTRIVSELTSCIVYNGIQHAVFLTAYKRILRPD